MMSPWHQQIFLESKEDYFWIMQSRNCSITGLLSPACYNAIV